MACSTQRNYKIYHSIICSIIVHKMINITANFLVIWIILDDLTLPGGIKKCKNLVYYLDTSKKKL